MKLTIKNTLNGVIVSEVSQSFTDINEYISFLAKFNIQIDSLDAAMDMHSEEVQLTIPCTAVSNDLGEGVAGDDVTLEQLEFKFNETASFEDDMSEVQEDPYAKMH